MKILTISYPLTHMGELENLLKSSVENLFDKEEIFETSSGAGFGYRDIEWELAISDDSAIKQILVPALREELDQLKVELDVENNHFDVTISVEE